MRLKLKTMNKIKYLFILTSLLFFSQGCQKDEIGVKDTTVIQSGPIETVQTEVVGIVTNEAGEAMANVTVQYKASFISTDENGYFKFEEVTAAFDGGLLKFNQDGFFNNYKWFYPEVSDKAFVRVIMIAEKEVGTISAGDGGSVELNGGATVTFPAGSFENTSGDLKIYGHWFDPSGEKLAEEMPGDLRGISSEDALVQLATFGMVAVEIRDGAGNEIQLKEGTKATIKFPLSDFLKDGAAETIKTWSFDEDRAYWKEEGSAVLDGNAYIAEVSHFSFWNCDAPFPLIHLTGRFTNMDKLGLSYVKICITDLTRAVTRVGWTSRDGHFSGKVPKNTPLKIVAKDECTGVVYEGEIGPFSDDINLGDIVADGGNTINIQGRLVCDGAPFTNGYALLIQPNGVQFIADVDGDGNFEINLPYCELKKISIKGYNLDKNSASDWTIYEELESSLDAGDIEVCDGNVLSEFIKYKIDGGDELILEVPDGIMKNNRLQLSAFDQSENAIELYINDPKKDDNPAQYVFAQLIGQQLSGACGSKDIRQPGCADMVITIEKIDLTVGGYIEGSFAGKIEGANGTSSTLTGSFKVKLDEITTCSLITGQVWIDSNNNGMRDAGDTEPSPNNFSRVSLYQNGNVIKSTWTDEEGKYSFEADAGNYSILFSLSQGYKFVDRNPGESDVDPATNFVTEFSVDGTSTYEFNAGKYWDDSIECEAVVIPASCSNDNGAYYTKANTIDSTEIHKIETIMNGTSISVLDFYPYQKITDLPAGSGEYIIKDAAGEIICSGELEIEDAPLVCDFDAFVFCENGLYTAGMEIICNNNSPGGYTYAWSNGATTNWFTISQPFHNLVLTQ